MTPNGHDVIGSLLPKPVETVVYCDMTLRCSQLIFLVPQTHHCIFCLALFLLLTSADESQLVILHCNMALVYFTHFLFRLSIFPGSNTATTK